MGTEGGLSQPYFSQFPIDGSRGLLFLWLQLGGTEQTVLEQGVSVQRRGYEVLLFPHFFTLPILELGGWMDERTDTTLGQPHTCWRG